MNPDDINIDPRLLKPYNPDETEDRIYKLWEESGFFNPDVCIEKGIVDKNAEPFSLILPPPNVTGTLHLGHAFEDTIEDILVRFARMQGRPTLWLPGTDHAAIATQSKVEKLIEKEEGKRKSDFTREEFLEKVNKFAQESHDTIVNQMKKMGASLDWSREAFTLDEKRNFAVRTAFKKMYDEGLIYRGHRIVNWDPKGQTTIADDEVVYVEEKAELYYLKYGPFVISTARPETKFGDKYVVMHPDDKRYAEYNHGDKLTVEWINGPIEATVIKDGMIDMEFGTGVMTITPWHSIADFELAEKYKLDKEQIIDKFGKLLPVAGEFSGMKIKDAREKIIEKLQSKGLVEKVEPYVHNIATAERSGGTIEPQIMNQWFINVNKEVPSRGNKTLKELMLEPVKNKNIDILPDRFEKVYYNWVENLRDWCISRQIWYGHRIPVWYKGEEVYCGIEAPAGDGWAQDEDTLDTWFSSGLWTFSTLGWPDLEAPDFKKFHPTTIIMPGYEILFFWVARMILMSQYLVGEIPFKTVYLHGIVRDKNGKKFSKSANNGIDPIDVIKEYGTDALRMSFVVGAGPGNDIKFDLQKVKAYKHFANKIWNITRFILSYTQNVTLDESFNSYTDPDKELVKERDELIETITKEIEEYKFYLAGEKLYAYTWSRLADVILEESRDILTKGNDVDKLSRAQFLLNTLQEIVKCLHPFMPFVTEEIWSMLPKENKQLLIVSAWPKK
jgi:valyl-tRNA synthetase